MTPLELKILLLKTGELQKEIAKDVGVSRPVVSRVVTGKERSKRVENAIAKLVNKNTDEIWPLVA